MDLHPFNERHYKQFTETDFNQRWSAYVTNTSALAHAGGGTALVHAPRAAAPSASTQPVRRRIWNTRTLRLAFSRMSLSLVLCCAAAALAIVASDTCV